MQNLAISRNLWYSFGMSDHNRACGPQKEKGGTRQNFYNPTREAHTSEKEVRNFLFHSAVTH